MVVRRFSDSSYLEYAPGRFDAWCVYMVNPQKNYRKPPKDNEYFSFMYENASRFGAEKIYNDFLEIYNLTKKEIDETVFSIIDEISFRNYAEKALSFSKVFSILYMGMIAEENKKHTCLGKRIKRLGVHMLLIEGRDVDYAANFMRNMNWRDIDVMCREYGF